MGDEYIAKRMPLRVSILIAGHVTQGNEVRAEKAYDEIVNLFARGARNRSGELTEAEAAELERLGEVEHLMQLIKARARHHT